MKTHNKEKHNNEGTLLDTNQRTKANKT